MGTLLFTYERRATIMIPNIIVFLLLMAQISRGKVVNLHDTVGEDNIGCDFKIVYNHTEVDIQRSSISCSKPTKMFEVDEIAIGNSEIEVKVSFKVLKEGNGRILKANIKKKSDGVSKSERDNEVMPMPTISELRLPEHWVNMTNMRNRDGAGIRKMRSWPDWGFRCTTNEYDGFQWCKCRPGQKVSSIYSHHDNRREDRQWTLKCKDIPRFSTERPIITTDENRYDGDVFWSGWISNSFLVGMTSFHSSRHEDRQFRFMTLRSDLWKVKSCGKWFTANRFDEDLHISTEDDEVIVGLSSSHDNRREDRMWRVYLCKLESECGTSGELEMDKNKIKISKRNPEFAHFTTIDASRSAWAITTTVKFQKSILEKMSETETYARTSGHKFGVGFKISKTTGVDLNFKKTSTGFEIGADYEYRHDTTYTKSRTTAYDEGRQGATEYTVTCLRGYICIINALIQKVTAKVPYTLTAGTCKEVGQVTIESAYAAEIIQEDTLPVACVDHHPNDCKQWPQSWCLIIPIVRHYCPKKCKVC